MRPSTHIAAAIVLACLVAVARPGADGHTPATDLEDALFRDLSRADLELDRRLARALIVKDDLIVIRDPLLDGLDLVVLPVRPTWALHCGAGITVEFARASNPPAPSREDAVPLGTGATAVEITLTTALLDDKTCAVLAPLVGARIRAILRDR